MIWITAEDVIALHGRVIQISGGMDGLRDRDGLEAAILHRCKPLTAKNSILQILRKLLGLVLGLHPTMPSSTEINASVL